MLPTSALGLGIAILIVVVIVGALSGVGRRGLTLLAGPALALRRFEVSLQPKNGIFIEIVGRRSGILSYLFTILGLEAEHTFRVDARTVEVSDWSLFSSGRHTIPTTQVASIHGGYSRSLSLLVLGIVTAAWGAYKLITAGQYQPSGTRVLFIAILLIGVLCLVAFGFSKRFGILVETAGGAPFGLNFKPSVIEGVNVDDKAAWRAVDCLTSVVLSARNRTATSAQESGAETVNRAEVSAGAACSKCGRKFGAESKGEFCPDCGGRVV